MPLDLSPQDWARLSDWFDTAADLGGAQQQAWLEALPQRDPEARRLLPWLKRLLAAHRTGHSNGPGPASGPATTAEPLADWLDRGPTLSAHDLLAHGPGSRVGPWLLHEWLGAGGQASVWRASRADALPAREVALKLPLAPRAGARLSERFAREREILARLSHPHIAPLYAAGVASDGTPWLAMELVRGEPLLAWCDARRLGLRERISLFHQVLDAVVYAHGQLVIHRDLKPSNLMVGEDGRVRLLDFGIAKLLQSDTDSGSGQDPRAADLTHFARPLTPAYAAPEQLRGDPLTAATDVYSLGVLLFELLTGSRPYRVDATGTGSPQQALEQAITEGRLLRASSAASRTSEPAAQARSSTPARLQQQLRGDLDTILAKALHLDPRERYASAAELADDLHRWAEHAPVRARPPSRRYRLGRFLRRYRSIVLASAVAFASLLGALGVSLVQVQRADAERDAALAQRGQGLSLQTFLLDQLIVQARETPGQALGEVLTRTEAHARAAFADAPDELAQALFLLGGQRRSFEGAQQALPALAEAMSLARDPNLRAEIACDHAAALYALGRRSEALVQVRGVTGDLQLRAGSRSLCFDYQVLLELAEGDLRAALRSEQQAMALHEFAPDTTGRARDRARMMLAYLQALNGEPGDVEAVFLQTLERLRATGREQSLTGVELRTRWSVARLAGGDAEGALALITRNVAGAEGPPPAPSLAQYLRLQGQALALLGRHPEARTAWSRARHLAQQSGDVRHLALLACLHPLLLPDASAGELAEAAKPLPAGLSTGDEARLSCQAALPSSRSALIAHPDTPPFLRLRALLLRARDALQAGQVASAKQDAEQALQMARRLQGSRARSVHSEEALRLRTEAERGLKTR